MLATEMKKYIKNELILQQKHRDDTRGSGVFLPESIGSYYMTVGAILVLQELCKAFKILYDENYSPWETDKDDENFNYCGSSGKIGRIEKNK